jgi:two-component system nitrate/nitrite response regulator NarL
MRIVICDDHRLLAEALATAIVRAGHTVVAVASTPAGAVQAVERHRPGVLLLDLTFPEGDSLQAAREVITQHPQTRTVVLTGSEAVGPLREALAIGVAGYLRKDERIDHMLATLERCMRGEQVIDEVLMRRLTCAVPERPQDPALTYELTVRERDVVDLLKHGLNTAEMVAELGISDSTVRTHVQSILNKLCVHSRIAAVALLDERLPNTVRAVS